MIFELLHAPYPEGYGEALLPLDLCKVHLRADSGSQDEDDLIAALRDASIEFVERYCSVRLRETEGQVWRAEGFPTLDSRPLVLGVRPVSEITDVTWRSGAGEVVQGAAGDIRVTAQGDLLPAGGCRWPRGVSGGVEITFTAGYPAGQAPASLLAAVRMFLGHLYKHREAVTDRGAEAEVPLGVRQLCAPFRRIVI